ncbi:MAG: glycosyltransferase family 25 protein [Planctomycetaceae bacterium]|jgi:GR25 family glycosyltransferase involved in LPS biosynthesis|nr:glycosyltransferase family 25 protein [Planctomycetaceae bacterium]
MISDTFERIYVINLNSRHERWDEFNKRLPADCPFLRPERFIGIDGRLVPPPVWWQSGPGGWVGCHLSHIRILQDCLNNDVNSVLVCENDAVFVDNFAEKVELFMQHLPDDWEFVYFGGKHPMMTLLGAELPDAWNDIFFICVDRPVADCYDTMFNSKWGWHPQMVKHSIDLQLAMREKFLEEYSPRFLRVSFKRMMQFHENTVQEICSFLGYTPTEQQYEQSLAFLNEQTNNKHFL